MKIVVVGCARSGTKYTAEYLKRQYGLDVPHERHGKDGIVAHYYGLPSTWREIKPKEVCIFHVVREPMAVANSVLPLLLPMLLAWKDSVELPNCEYEGYPSILTALAYWHDWNLLIEKNFPFAHRFKVESLDPENKLSIPKNLSKFGFYEHGRYTWDQVKWWLDPPLRKGIMALREKYVYCI